MSGRDKSSRIWILLILIFFLILFIFDTSSASEIKWSSQKQFHQERNESAIVISCQFDSTLKKDFLDNNQFEWSDSLTYARFYLLDATKDIKLIAILVKSPSENRTVYDLEEVPATDNIPISYRAENIDVLDPLLFNEEGIWAIKFHLNTSNVYIYEYDGYHFDSDSSEVIPISGGYKGIEILSPSVVQQIKVGKISEELLTWQKWAVVMTVGTLVVTASMVYFTKKSISESLKEKRRNNILPIIVKAIDEDAEYEFLSLNSSINSLQQEKIVVLPSNITSNTLKEAKWRDFRRECPDLYDKLDAYVNLKGQYSERFHQLEISIKESLNHLRNDSPEINNQIQQIINNRNLNVPLERYYRDEIEGPFVHAILDNENSLRQRRNHALFEQFEDSLLGIRRNEVVRGHIEALLDYLDDLREYSQLMKILAEKKEKLMNNYNLYDGDLEVYKQQNNHN